MKQRSTLLVLASALALAGCTRIETGEVGLRVGIDKQISGTELLPGSFNQTLVGDVLTFPQGPRIRVIRVLALGLRRGPAPEAQALYLDLEPDGSAPDPLE